MNNFDKKTNRLKTNCYKWDLMDDGVLPFWVADMDFEISDAIFEGFKKRIEHKIFGYTMLGDDFYNAYISWRDRRHHFKIEKDWILFSTGVVPTISSAIRRLSNVSNNVIVLTPVYNVFFNSIINNGREVLESPLIYKDGNYFIDFDDLESKLKDPETEILLLCNPQNPSGRIWTRDELEKIGFLCKKYNVTVISDEIHCDLVDPNCEYIPFASINETNKNISVTCVSPTKAFNLAAVQTSAVIIPNEYLRHKVDRGLNTDEVAEPNFLAAIVPHLAFDLSEGWLDELREYIFENKKLVREFFEKELPEIPVINGGATYLMWLDCSKICKNSAELNDFFKNNAKIYLNAGNIYGKNGDGFLRMNVATQRENVVEGLRRFKKGIKMYLENR